MKERLLKKNQAAISKFLEARVHLGHKTTYWKPSVKAYLYGARQGVHIIDLKKSFKLLAKALSITLELLRKKESKILILGNKAENSLFIKALKKKYVSPQLAFGDSKWVGGSLTNKKVLQLMKLSSTYYREVLGDFKPSSKNPHNYVFKRPNLILLLNPNPYLLNEAQRLKIPVIGILDTDTCPEAYSYPIPGNDDSIPSHYLYIELFSYLLSKTLNQSTCK
jgi:small subunit ribosomal protein S2